MTLASTATASFSPKRVIISPRSGVAKIGQVRVGPISKGYPTPTLAEVTRQVGKPRRIRRPYSESCNAFYGTGLELIFASFGGERRCGPRALQAGTISKRVWRVVVGDRTYRVGMPKRVIPKRAKRYPGYGFQLASMPFLGRRTPSAFAKVGNRGRISSLGLFIGGAGD